MRSLLLAQTLVLLLCSTVRAGPLVPPAGPVAPTPGPEPRVAVNAINTPGDADSLFKITQPGSYYLTGNITGVVGKHGIEIDATGVTLDLNGFELRGVNGMGAFDGVTAVDSATGAGNITVRNGSVRGWGDCGIEFNSNNGHPTEHAIVIDIHASGNGRDGVAVQDDSIVTRCTATENLGYGISTLAGCTVTECSAGDNGFAGISTNTGCTVTACTVSGNDTDGISVGLGSTVTNCTASNNHEGFRGQGCTFAHCTAYSNSGIGIFAFSGCMISHCVVYQNAGEGILGSSSATVAFCTAYQNTLDGIRVTNDCSVLSNTCDANGNGGGDGAGIHATGTDNRIEGNNCTDSDRGIDVDSGGNFIARNTCAGNTSNWEVAVGNVCLVVLATDTGVAISGDSGGVSPGSTNPNTNYTY